jgi:MFS family permease
VGDHAAGGAAVRRTQAAVTAAPAAVTAAPAAVTAAPAAVTAAPAAVPSPRAAGGPAQGTRESPARATFTQVFAVGEFRAVWLAMLLSVAGDQLARVAMTVLVYDRTRSPFLTALTYAVTLLPWLVGGVGLSGIADRLPRRQVMIACDLARMVVVLAMVAASLAGSAAALWAMVALLFLVTLLDSPFKSARAALVADILTGERYVLGTTVTQLTFQVGMVLGFALGGVTVAALGTRGALGTDAATFAVSALLLSLWVRRRPAAAGPGGTRPSHWADMAAGVRLVFGDRTLRTLVLFGWLVTFYIVPMALAAPYAARFRGLPLAVGTGLVFAALPLGTAVGAFVLGRLVSPARRQRWMGAMAVGSCAVLMLCWARPGFAASLAVFMVAGLFAGYQVAANSAFVAAVPPERRGQAFGLANGGMQVFQGVWFIIVGALAGLAGPGAVIAVSGCLGAVIAIGLAARWATRAVPAASRP